MNLRARSSVEVRQQYLAQLGIIACAENTTIEPGHSEVQASPTVLQRLNQDPPVWWRQIFIRNSKAEQHDRAHKAVEGRIIDEKKVSFKEMVEVRFVPIFSDYSQRVRESYWNNSQDIWDAATRNTFEFESEGYDWRQAFEEEDFTQWGGQLVHPAHTHANDYLY